MNENPYSVGEQPTFNDTRLQGPEFERALRGMRIVAAALMMGVVCFLGVVLFTTQGKIGGIQKAEFMTIFGAGFAALMIVNHFVIPQMVTKRHLEVEKQAGLISLSEEEKTNKVIGIYRGQLIIGLALLEGAAFLNLICMMTDQSLATLGVVAVLMGLMLMKFPTRDKVTFWVQDKLRELQM